MEKHILYLILFMLDLLFSFLSGLLSYMLIALSVFRAIDHLAMVITLDGQDDRASTP